MKTPCCFVGLLIATAASSTCTAQLPTARPGDWPWWRGPHFSGVAESGQQTPVAWSETENVVWKVPVPGRGHSSPTVVGDRIFLTTADDQTQVQSIVCFDRDTGKQLWSHDANRGGFPSRIHRKNTHASCSVACDSSHVFATFLNHDGIQVVAVDFEGTPIWSKVAGEFTPDEYKHGYGASPLLYGNLVIVAGDFDGDGFLVALDRKTGKQIWKTPRPARISYASPVVADVAGEHQLPISASPVLSGELIYASNERGTSWVYRATPEEFQLIKQNQLGTESFATPIICGNQIFLRVADSAGGERQETLYCIAAPGV